MWLYACVLAGLVAQNAPSADALLKRATQQGTPSLIASRAMGGTYLVTFVWRGSLETRNVAVIGTFLKAPIAAMARIGESECGP